MIQRANSILQKEKVTTVISSDRRRRFTVMRTNEQERNITFKSTGVSLFFEHGATDAVCSKLYLINLIDSPDQVDSSLEATVDYRDIDGVMG